MTYHSKMDKKGRIVIPSMLREKYMFEEVEIHEESGKLIIEGMEKITDPIAYLASIKIKTKKSPKEMKKEVQKLMESE